MNNTITITTHNVKMVMNEVEGSERKSKGQRGQVRKEKNDCNNDLTCRCNIYKLQYVHLTTINTISSE